MSPRWVAIAVVVLASGCVRLVTENEMKDASTVARIAREVVKTRSNAHPRLGKVALIGVNATRTTQRCTTWGSRPKPMRPVR